MADGDTFVNSLLGAVVTVVLAPLIPFSPVVGGFVAGYLQGGDSNDGLTVGAVAGVIALLPLVLVVLLVGTVLLLFATGAMGLPQFFRGLGIVVLLFGVVVALVYTVGLSALGGWLGNYVKYDTDVGSAAQP